MARCDVLRRECFHDHVVPWLAQPRLNGEGTSAKAYCPAHPDRDDRSLSVSIGEQQRIIWRCFAGCSTLAIRAALIRCRPILADCLPVPKADDAELVDAITALYAKDLSHPELRWRVWSLVQGFSGEMPARGRYPGGRRGFAREAGVSHSDVYGRAGHAR